MKFVLKDAFVSIDGVDLSDHFSSVTIEGTFDEVDLTGFGSNFKEMGKGLGDATVTLAAFQDMAAASVDATLWPLFESDDTFPVIVRATSAVVSATNPQYNLTGRLFNYSPIAGDIGSAATTPVTIRNADAAGLTRTVA